MKPDLRFPKVPQAAVPLAALALVFLSSCNRYTTKVGQWVGGEVAPPLQTTRQGDTLSYVVVFRDKAERRHFIKTFESFLDRYPYVGLRRDSIAGTVVVRVLPAQGVEADTGETFAGIDLRALDRREFVETVIEHTVDSIAAFRPDFGGSVVIYSERTFWDEHLSALVEADPFAVPRFRVASDTADTANLQPPRPLIVGQQLNPSRISLELPPQLKNAAGRSVSAFDLVEKWTAFVKEHPAEGLALFRHVKGVVPFIQGREAVIPGLVVSGPTTITLVLERPDPDALLRLATPRLLPRDLRLGPYAVSANRGGATVVAANRIVHDGPPYLERCTVVLNRDKNPFLSYSLKKYDYMTVTFREDIEYARTKLAAESRLKPLEMERYFLSVNHPTPAVREALASAIDPAQVLNGAVKAEGNIIGAIESEGPVPTRPRADLNAHRPASPVEIVFRKGDPVSSRIAEKLLADMAAAQVPCELRGLDAHGYESALVDRSFTIAIGWVGARVLRDRAAQLRLATMWFGDEQDEQQRLKTHIEIPLFALRRYVLCRNRYEFAGDTISDIYVQREQPEEEQQANER
ncbi:MAG: hypothetical protein GF331_05800 [Chitinivibrionales bacterium]|nr:hypothetical protein [Chitinivibrionales bacterium]